MNKSKNELKEATSLLGLEKQVYLVRISSIFRVHA
jgi:hypothetical protein